MSADTPSSDPEEKPDAEEKKDGVEADPAKLQDDPESAPESSSNSPEETETPDKSESEMSEPKDGDKAAEQASNSDDEENEAEPEKDDPAPPEAIQEDDFQEEDLPDDDPQDVLDTKSLAQIHKERGLEQDLLETQSINQLRSSRGSKKAGSERMQKAYGLVNNLLRDRLEQEGEENLELLEELQARDVLVVNGTYDHIHLVLESLKIPFLTTFPNALTVQELRPDQTIFVNCGRDFPVVSAFALERFVRAGGQMISTDWALNTVLKVAFPRYVTYNRRPTKDEVVGIEVLNKDDPVLAGFIDEEENPVWWLEDASYPIKILDKKNVEVLIRSKELGQRYGEDAVLVKFHHGEGVVYHMISHFYLQRAETRSAKQKSKASSYAKSKGASAATLAQFEEVEAAMGNMDYGLTQSAMTSAEFVSRSILSQRKRYLNKTKKAPGAGRKKPESDSKS